MGILIGCTSLTGTAFAKGQKASAASNASSGGAAITDTSLQRPVRTEENPEKWILPQTPAGYLVQADTSQSIQANTLYSVQADARNMLLLAEPAVTVEVEKNPSTHEEYVFVYANGRPVLIKEDGGKTYVYDESGSTKLSERALDKTSFVYGGGKDTAVSGGTQIVIESGTVGNVYGGGRNAMVQGDTSVRFEKDATIEYLYGGGENSKVTGKVSIVGNGGDVEKAIVGGGCGGQKDTDASVGSVDMQLTAVGTRRITGGGYSTGATVKGAVAIQISSCTGIELFSGGGYGIGTAVGSVDVSIKDSEFNMYAINIYGGGVYGEVEGDVNFVLDTVIGPVIYGGSYVGAIKGNIYVTVKGSSAVKEVYGGNYYKEATVNVDEGEITCSGYVGKDIFVTIADTSVVSISIFGGSGSGEVRGNTHVYIHGGEIGGAVYGGNAYEGAVLGDSEVVLTDGTVKNSIFGGGYSVPTMGKSSVTMRGGTVEYNVFGGGQEAGAISENSGIYLYGGTIQSPSDNPDTQGRLICGGGADASVTDSCEVVLDGTDIYGWLFGGCLRTGLECVNTDVQLLSGYVHKNAYGGGAGGYVSNAAKITSDGATVNGWLYGGGEDADCSQSSLVLKSGRAEHNVYGGGMNGTSGNTLLSIEGDANLGGWIYGGAENGSVTDTARVTLKSGTINTSVVGGSFDGYVNRTEVLLDGAVAGDIFGGGDSSSTSVDHANVILRSGKASAVYGGGVSGAVASANMITEGTAEVDAIYAGGMYAGSTAATVTVGGGRIAVINGSSQYTTDAIDTTIRIKTGNVGQVIPGTGSGIREITIDGGSIQTLDPGFGTVQNSEKKALEQVVKDMGTANANTEVQVAFGNQKWFSYTDGSGKLYLWMPVGTKAEDIGVVQAVPIVKDLLFTNPGNRGGSVAVTVDGMLLERANSIMVNCDHGVAGAAAVLQDGKYTAVLEIPANNTASDKTYTLSVLVDGGMQTVTNNTITVPALVQSGTPIFRSGLPASAGKEITAAKGTLAVTDGLTYEWYRSADQVFDNSDVKIFSGSAYTPVKEDIGSYLVLAAKVPGLVDAYTVTPDPIMAKLITFFDAITLFEAPNAPRPGNVIAVPKEDVAIEIWETREILKPSWKAFLDGSEITLGTETALQDKTYVYHAIFTAPEGCVFDPATFSTDGYIAVSKDGKTLTAYFRVKALGITAPPEKLVGAAPTEPGGQDGKITGTSTDMEYRPQAEKTYQPCTGLEITGLASGTYCVRFREKPGFIASEDAYITVQSKLDTPSGLVWKERTAKWNPVANAQYYLVTLYQDGEALKTLILAANDGFGHLYETDCDFETEITKTGSYTFTVMAMVGSNMDYVSGNPSKESDVLKYRKKDDSTRIVIDARAGSGGNISPAGSIAVDYHASKTFQITPDAGYVVKDVFVNGKPVGAVKTYTFEKIETSATIYAEFEKKASVGGGGKQEPKAETEHEPEQKKEPMETETKAKNSNFVDVESHWAREAILLLLEQGIVSGISDTEFGPDLSVSRGMFVTFLGRIEKVKADVGNMPFSDVSEDSYYAPYIKWAYDNHIVTGVGNQEFAPDKDITREQMAQIVYHYLQYKEVPIGDLNPLDGFQDADGISEWAKEAAAFCYSRWLIRGKEERLFVPMDHATRAEAASILVKMLQEFDFS